MGGGGGGVAGGACYLGGAESDLRKILVLASVQRSGHVLHGSTLPVPIYHFDLPNIEHTARVSNEFRHERLATTW